MAKKPPKTKYYRNKRSGNLWKLEPFFAYKVTNLTSGAEYFEMPDLAEKRLESENAEILDAKAAEVLFGDND